MASTKNRTKTQAKKSQIEMLVPILIGAVVILALISSYLAWQLKNQVPHKTPQAAEKVGNGFVSLGSLGFRFEGGKAVARHDATTQEILNFLKKEVEKSGCDDNSGAASVITYSRDEKQLLLGFGCGNTVARMFAVKKEDGWKAISPTNQFNLLDIPSCKMTDENNISREIAPVCQNEKKVGDNLSYDYKIR